MDNSKEGYFGLPEILFNSILIYLQGLVTTGGAPGAPALTALVSLAKSEHAAAASTYEVRLIDAVFRSIELNNDLMVLKNTPTAGLPPALLAFAGKLDALANFWYGK